MKRRREEIKWPPHEELVELICEPAGEFTNANGTITVQHRCPHPYCNHKSGGNIIGRHGSHAGVFSHLKSCIGRHGNLQSLYNLYKEIKENQQDRTEILNRFRAETIARMKPNSGGIVQHSRKQQKLWSLLSASERQDIDSSLEHVCMIGAKNRHDEKRRRLFETTHKDLLEKEHKLPLDAPPANPFGPPTHPDNNLFAEDLRVYGQYQIPPFREAPDNASCMEAWPRPEKKTPRRLRYSGLEYDDNKWNSEHGDTINTLPFTMARLSQKIPSAKDQELMNGTNLLVDTTNVMLHGLQIPKALLQRCWERAVHASSCVAFASKGDVETTESTFSSPSISPTPNNNESPQSLYNIVQERTARTEDGSFDKLQAMGLEYFFNNLARIYKLKCPVCSRQFDHISQFASCYYGGMEASNTSKTGFRGCCWDLIKKKQYSTIESALTTHIRTQTSGMMDIIMKAADERLPNRVGQDGLRLFNWYDVLKFVEESLASSQTVGDIKREKGVTSALETLEVQSGATPIFLNPAVLEAVRIRLIDRYADVPY